MEWGAKSRSLSDIRRGNFFQFAFPCALLVDERFHFWKIGYWFRLYLSQVPYIIDTLEAERIAVFHAWRLQLWGLIKETRAWHIAVEFEWSEAFGCLVLLLQFLQIARWITLQNLQQQLQQAVVLRVDSEWNTYWHEKFGTDGVRAAWELPPNIRVWPFIVLRNIEMCIATCTPPFEKMWIIWWREAIHLTSHSTPAAFPIQ